MPNPTLSDLHVQAPLTDISVAFSQDLDVFVASKVFAQIPVQKQANKFFTYNKEDWLRTEARPRAPGKESASAGFRVTTDNYVCDRVALNMPVSDPERANADPAVNLDADATEYVTQQIKLREEIDWVSNYFSTGSGWTGASNSTNLVGQAAPATTTNNFRQWNDAASVPIEDIRGEITSVARNTGRKPNTLVLGAQVWTALADHPDILDRIKYTEKGVVTTDLIASLLDLDNVYVMWATNETTAEPSSSPSKSFVAGKAALLCYSEKSPGLRKPSAGYTFVWTGAPGQPMDGARMKKFRDEPKESDIIEGERWYVQKQVSASLGVFFASAVA